MHREKCETTGSSIIIDHTLHVAKNKKKHDRGLFCNSNLHRKKESVPITQKNATQKKTDEHNEHTAM